MLPLPTLPPQRGEETGVDPSRREWIAQLYQVCQRPMWRSAVGILRDEHLAWDVVQSVFQKVIEKRDLLAGLEDSKLHAYLTVMVRNTAYTLCRQRRRQPVREVQALLESVPDPCETPEERAIRRWEYQAVEEARTSLSAAHRDLLTMKFVYQYTDQQIARLLGIRPASVRVATHRALQSIRRACRNRML